MKAPNLKTRKEEIETMREDGESVPAILFSGMFGSLQKTPEYNDADEIYREAFKDLKDMNFGDMGAYIDSLCQLVDHWKELAEHYLECVDAEKYEIDEYGYLDEKPNLLKPKS